MDEEDGFQTIKAKQTDFLKSASESIWESSRNFDIDSSTNATDSVFDRLIQ